MAYVNGTAGGQDLIAGFNSRTDRIVLSGYGSGAIADAVSSAHAVSGGIAFSLSDGTQVTVVGVTRLTSASFQLG